MPTITETATVRIERPVEEVFDYFTDISNDVEWNPFVKEAEKTSTGPLGVGTTFYVVRKMSGPMDIEYTEYVRPTRWAIRGTGRSASMTFIAEFTRADNATEMSISMALQPRGAFVLLTPVMRSQLPKQIDQVHEALKRKLGSGHSGTSRKSR
jgi:carbon monoxide dehydrogenase subunit G